jgi:hypothetical protein
MKKLWRWLFGTRKQQCNIPDVSTRTFSRNEVDRLLKVQRDKCAARATHFANEKVDSPTIFNYVNSTPIEDF